MKKLFLVFFISISCSVFAQNIMSEFEAYKKQQKEEFKNFISGGSYYSEPVDTKLIDTVTVPKTVDILNYTDYKAAFDSHIARLEEQFTIFAGKGFNPVPYAEKAADLEEGTFNAYYIQIVQKDGVYNVSYRIAYNDDYKVLQAWKNPALKSKLNNNEKLLYNEATKLLSKLTKENMSEYDKVLAIHDWLVLNITYDEKVLSDFSANPNAFKAYGAIIEKTAVCEGYSKSMNLLGNMAGVEIVKVNGTANTVPHSWNKAAVGGKWYNLDVTYDDPMGAPKNVIYYNYFNITDSMLKADHDWDRSRYPAATSIQYNYFVHNGLVADNFEEFAALVKSEVSAGKNKYVSVYLTDYNKNNYPLSFISAMGLKNPRYYIPQARNGVFTLVYD